MLEDSDRLHELIEISSDAEGKSSYQFNKYADTIEYRLNKIKNTWEQIRVSFLNEKTYKTWLDRFQGVLNKVKDFDIFDVAWITTTFITIGAAAGKGLLAGLKQSVNSAGVLLTSLGSKISNFFLGPKTGGFGTFLGRGMNAGQEWLDANKATPVRGEGESEQSYTDRVNEWKQKTDAMTNVSLVQGRAIGTTLATSITAAFTAVMMKDNPGEVLTSVLKTGLLSLGTQVLPIITTFYTAVKTEAITTAAAVNAAFSTIVIIALITGVVALAAAGYKKFSNALKESTEEALKNADAGYKLEKELDGLKEKEEELGQAAQEANSKLNEQKDEYDSLIKNVKEYEELKNKSFLTDSESEQFADINLKLQEQISELIIGYDAEGNAIFALKEKYDDLIKKKKEYLLLSDKESAEADVKAMGVNLAEALVNEQLVYTNSFENILTTLNTEIYKPKKGRNNTLIDTEYQRLMGFLENYNGDNEIIQKQYEYLQEKVGESYTATPLSRDEAQLRAALQQIIGEYDNMLKDEKEEFARAIGVPIDEGAANLAIHETELEIQKMQNSIKQLVADNLALDKNLGVDESLAKTLANIFTPNLTKEDIVKEIDEWDSIEEYEEHKVSQLISQTSQIAKTITDEDKKTWQLIQSETGESADSYIQTVVKYWNKLSDASKNGFYTYNAEMLNSQSVALRNNADLLGLNDEYIYKEMNYVYNGVSTNWDIVVAKTGSALEKIENMSDQAKEALFNAVDMTSEKGMESPFISWFTDIAKDKSITSQDLSILATTDWDFTIDEEGFRDQLKDSGLSEQAQKIVDEERKNFQLYFGTGLFNLEAMEDQINDYEDELTELLAATQSVYKDMVEQGTLDESTIKKLRSKKINAPFEKFLDENNQFSQDVYTEWVQGRLNQLSAFIDSVMETYKQEEQGLIDLRKDIHSIAGNNELGIGSHDTLTDEDKNALFNIDELATATGLSMQFINEIIQGSDTIHDIIEAIGEALEANGVKQDTATVKLKGLVAESNALNNAQAAQLKQNAEDREEALKKIKDAEEAVADAYQSILDKQEDLIDKQEKLNEAIYGTANRKSSQDNLYNYQTALDSITTSIEDAKDALEDLHGQDPSEFLDDWISGSRNKAAYLLAENDRYAASINATENSLQSGLANMLANMGYGYDTNTSKFYNYNDKLGIYELNQSAINMAALPDDVKSYIEEYVNAMNDAKKAIRSNQKEIKNLEKEFEDYRKKLRDNYIQVQDEVVKKLEESYKKAIEDKKSMYDGIKDADNDYLDALQKALDKQKELRDKQNKWEELAEKEKKLSLISRDTSGANAKQTKQLRKDIKKDRQSMLDDSINNIVKGLKDLYDEQQKTREEEIEYREAVLENADLVTEANAIMQSWKSMDEMVSWMWDHTEGIEKMSDEAVEKLTDNWKDMFDDIQTYNEYQQKEVETIFDFTAGEIQNIAVNTSETLVSESERALNELTQSVNDSITSANKAVTDAMTALADAQKKYNEQLEKLNQLYADYEHLINNNPPGQDGGSGESNYNMFDHSSPTAAQASEEWKATHKFDYSTPVEVSSGVDLFKTKVVGNGSVNSAIAGMMQHNQKYIDITPNASEAYWEDIIKEIISKYPEAQGKIGMKTYGDKGIYFFPDGASKHIMDTLGGSSARIFASGGLVNYTGPAWVDGSKSRPEAFLSAEDTARIGEAANLLSQIARYSSRGTLTSAVTNSVGDTNVELHFHVDSIATNEQVDYLVDRVKEEIVEVANPIGTSVILHQ